jgi:hypothetical protein
MSWHDKGTDKTFHFDDSGNFIDSDGNKPSRGFNLKDDEFANWMHKFVQNKLFEMGFETTDNEKVFMTHNALNSPEKLLVLINYLINYYFRQKNYKGDYNNERYYGDSQISQIPKTVSIGDRLACASSGQKLARHIGYPISHSHKSFLRDFLSQKLRHK